MNNLMLHLASFEPLLVRKSAWSWFTDSNSLIGSKIDVHYQIIIWMSVFWFVLLMGLMFWFIIKYRRRPGVPTERSPSHNTALELAWSIIPLLIMVWFFFIGFKGYMEAFSAPAGAEEIQIVGRTWQWDVKYDNGAAPTERLPLVRSTEMVGEGDDAVPRFTNSVQKVPVIVVPAGRPIKLVMRSTDVLHSFYVPDFRVKRDVIPNRYTFLWFQAEEAGREHVVFCTEYCGDSHSEMAAMIKVVSEDVYQRWKKDAGNVKLEGAISELGDLLWDSRGCNACHSVDGANGTGPSWKSHSDGSYGWGTPRRFTDGTSIDAADENYLRESILYGSRKIVEGYGSEMPPYAGMLSDDEVDVFINYIKYLNNEIEDFEYTSPGAEPAEGEAEADGGDA